MTDQEALTDDPETLRTQLEILNARSRWYASQMWHMPFAYFGITGVAVGMAGSSALDPCMALGHSRGPRSHRLRMIFLAVIAVAGILPASGIRRVLAPAS